MTPNSLIYKNIESKAEFTMSHAYVHDLLKGPQKFLLNRTLIDYMIGRTLDKQCVSYVIIQLRRL